MTATVIKEGKARRVAFTLDEPTARYTPATVLRGTATAGATVPAGPPRRLVVETLHNVGGMIQRALLGAEFVPGPAATVSLGVGLSGPMTSGHPAGCASALGMPLVAGLPDEFGQPILTALTDAAPRLPGGTLTVDRAGYDERGSSPRAFRLAATLLVDLLAAQLTDQDPAVRMQAALRGW